MNTFKNSPSILEKRKALSKYPQAISNLFEKVMGVDEKPKEGLYKTIWEESKKEFLNFETLRLVNNSEKCRNSF